MKTLRDETYRWRSLSEKTHSLRQHSANNMQKFLEKIVLAWNLFRLSSKLLESTDQNRGKLDFDSWLVNLKSVKPNRSWIRALATHYRNGYIRWRQRFCPLNCSSPPSPAAPITTFLQNLAEINYIYASFQVIPIPYRFVCDAHLSCLMGIVKTPAFKRR